MKKQDKFTQIYFSEADPMMEIDTHNTNLKRRLTTYAKKHPDLCHIVSDDGDGGISVAIDKRRCSIRLTAPYSKERKQAASELARQSGVHTRINRGKMCSQVFEQSVNITCLKLTQAYLHGILCSDVFCVSSEGGILLVTQ